MPHNENTGNENTGELHVSPLAPADDERIRRLLAEARHTEPMPEAVAARLDRVLAGLSADRAERDEPRAPVVELAARRRRTAANLLVAAAAVLAVGFGVTQVLPGLGGSSADESPSATTLEEGGAAADSAGGDSRNSAPEAAPEAATEEDGDAPKATFRIRSEQFGPDVRRVRNQVESGDAPALLENPDSSCLAGTVDAGSKVVSATYDAAPAALVLRPPSGDVQVVDLYLCGDAAPRRSITLTSP